MATTTYFSNSLLNYVFGASGSTVNQPTMYLAAFAVLPGRIDPGRELDAATNSGYSRAWINPNVGASAGHVNVGHNGFDPATGNWEPVVGFGIFDLETGGNLLWYAEAPTPIVILNGGQLGTQVDLYID
jgi:hypothetical protein